MLNEQKKEYNYRLRLHDTENNQSMTARFNQKGAELWQYLATRGFVMLVWDSGVSGGYYYTLSKLKEAMKKLYDEGLTKKGGYYYSERYYL